MDMWVGTVGRALGTARVWSGIVKQQYICVHYTRCALIRTDGRLNSLHATGLYIDYMNKQKKKRKKKERKKVTETGYELKTSL